MFREPPSTLPGSGYILSGIWVYLMFFCRGSKVQCLGFESLSIQADFRSLVLGLKLIQVSL